MMLHKVLLASLLATAHSWVVPSVMGGSCVAAGSASTAATALVGARFGTVCMEEAAGDSAAAAVSDFTEDLLEALTTDDEPLVDDEPAVVVKGAEGVELAQLPSYHNAESIAAMRSKCVAAPPLHARPPAAALPLDARRGSTTPRRGTTRRPSSITRSAS